MTVFKIRSKSGKCPDWCPDSPKMGARVARIARTTPYVNNVGKSEVAGRAAGEDFPLRRGTIQ